MRDEVARRPRPARRRPHPPRSSALVHYSEAAGRLLLPFGLGPLTLRRRRRRARRRQDPREHGDRPQRDARPVRLDARSGARLAPLRVGHRRAPATTGATRTTSSTTRSPTSSARIATSATPGCASAPSSAWRPRARGAAAGGARPRLRVRVGRRHARPPRRRARSAASSRSAPSCGAPRPFATQGRVAARQGLRVLSRARARQRAARRRRQPARQRRPQPVDVRDHLLRPLPRRRRGLPRGGDGEREPRRSGTCASCAARRTSRAGARSTS